MCYSQGKDSAWLDPIKQSCPTLSQFATCDDRRFKRDDRELFKKEFIYNGKFAFDKSGDSKVFFATFVFNMTTGRMWLDNNA
jgi:hypothetical protein